MLVLHLQTYLAATVPLYWKLDSDVDSVCPEEHVRLVCAVLAALEYRSTELLVDSQEYPVPNHFF